MTFWRCSFEVEATDQEAVRLRKLVPELLQTAGYRMTSGTRTVELGLAEATERLAAEAQLNRNGHHGPELWMPISRNSKLGVRRLGHGPSS